MKKFRLAALLITMMLLAIGLFCGCSKSDDFEPTADCLYVREDGTVAETLFETLDKDYFNVESLRAFVEDAVVRYNSDAAGVAKAYMEEDEELQLPVSVGNLVMDENRRVTLTLEYATTKHYISFNGEDSQVKQLSTGSVESALSVGVNLNVGMMAVKDGSAVSQETIQKHGSYRVVLIQGVTDLQVQGKVMYISDGVTKLADSLVHVDSDGDVAYIIFK